MATDCPTSGRSSTVGIRRTDESPMNSIAVAGRPKAGRARGIRDNIAGFQGFLQFRLPGKPGSLVRKGLKIKPNGSDQALLIKLRADAPLEIEALANGKSLGSVMKVSASKQFKEVRLPLTGNTNWKNVIKSLEIKLKGSEGSNLEVDLIEVKRS